jgi:hypothetical protein
VTASIKRCVVCDGPLGTYRPNLALFCSRRCNDEGWWSFGRVLDRLQGDRYWEFLYWVWVYSKLKNRRDNREHQRDWLGRYPRHRSAMMLETDRRRLAELPDVIDVWRGMARPDDAAGFSWSLDRKVAVYFTGTVEARILLQGRVARDDVIAYLGDPARVADLSERGSLPAVPGDTRWSAQEIIALPEHVMVVSERRLGRQRPAGVAGVGLPLLAMSAPRGVAVKGRR